MPRRRVIPLLAFLTLASTGVAAADRSPARALQATVVERGWTLTTEGRRARVSTPDGVRRSFRVRSDERWLGFSETPSGWIATGIRPDQHGLDLSVVADFGNGPRRLMPPEDRIGAYRTRPVALTGEAGLEGIAWLEGDDIGRLAVRVADLDGSRFSAGQTVSPAGRRSQTGLVAQRLDDGSSLLVWSRHDGNDDELVWSIRRPEGKWSPPRALTAGNDVPDITPDLMPTPGGAIVAWSRLDGEYRVLTARFQGGVWSAPRPVGGQGSLFPTFRRLDTGDYLLLRNAYPGGWTAFDLRSDGVPMRFATVVEESRRPPVLVQSGRSEPAFLWPHRDREMALAWEELP